MYQRVFRSTREAKKEAKTRLEADGLPTLTKRRRKQLASSNTNWERAGLRTKSGLSSLLANWIFRLMGSQRSEPCEGTIPEHVRPEFRTM